jgi:hypothetical protein
MALSVFAINAAKGRDKPYKLADTDGLYLLITPVGGRYWRMNYRHLGKPRGNLQTVFICLLRQQGEAVPGDH